MAKKERKKMRNYGQSDIASFHVHKPTLSALTKRKFQESLRQEFGIITPDYEEPESQNPSRH